MSENSAKENVRNINFERICALIFGDCKNVKNLHIFLNQCLPYYFTIKSAKIQKQLGAWWLNRLFENEMNFS